MTIELTRKEKNEKGNGFLLEEQCLHAGWSKTPPFGVGGDHPFTHGHGLIAHRRRETPTAVEAARHPPLVTSSARTRIPAGPPPVPQRAARARLPLTEATMREY